MSDMHVALALIVSDGRVLAWRDASGGASAPWSFPAWPVQHDVPTESLLHQHALEELGVHLSTTWLLDTSVRTTPAGTHVVDCFVCASLPEQDVRPELCREVCWVGWDELADMKWHDEVGPVVSLLGQYWDQLFASEHL